MTKTVIPKKVFKARSKARKPISVIDAAKQIGIGKTNLYSLLERGLFKARRNKTPSGLTGKFLIYQSDIDAYLVSLEGEE